MFNKNQFSVILSMISLFGLLISVVVVSAQDYDWQCNLQPVSLVTVQEQDLRSNEGSQASTNVPLRVGYNERNIVTSIGEHSVCPTQVATMLVPRGTIVQGVLTSSTYSGHSAEEVIYTNQYFQTEGGLGQVVEIHFVERPPADLSVVLGSEVPGYKYGIFAINPYASYYEAFVPDSAQHEELLVQLAGYDAYLVADTAEEVESNTLLSVHLADEYFQTTNNAIVAVADGMLTSPSVLGSFGSAVAPIGEGQNAEFHFYQIPADSLEVIVMNTGALKPIVADEATLQVLLTSLYRDLGSVELGCSDSDFQLGHLSDNDVEVFHHGVRVGQLGWGSGQGNFTFDTTTVQFSTIPYNSFSSTNVNMGVISAADGELLYKGFPIDFQGTICPQLDL